MGQWSGSKQPHAQPPDAAALQDAALTYLTRYASTEATLLRTLERRIDRWARFATTPDTDRDAIAAQVGAARQTARAIVARLAATGAVNDAAFAESRMRSLTRAGRSRRAISAHLAAKGISAEAQRRLLPEDVGGSEFAAALVLSRRRRIGPFRVGPAPDTAGRRRELAIFARAGFPQSIAARALATDPAEAEALVNQLRR